MNGGYYPTPPGGGGDYPPGYGSSQPYPGSSQPYPGSGQQYSGGSGYPAPAPTAYPGQPNSYSSYPAASSYYPGSAAPSVAGIPAPPSISRYEVGGGGSRTSAPRYDTSSYPSTGGASASSGGAGRGYDIDKRSSSSHSSVYDRYPPPAGGGGRPSLPKTPPPPSLSGVAHHQPPARRVVVPAPAAPKPAKIKLPDKVFACKCTVVFYDTNTHCGLVELIGSGGVTANCFFDGRNVKLPRTDIQISNQLNHGTAVMMHGGLQDSSHAIPYCASFIWFPGKNKELEESYYPPSADSIQLYKKYYGTMMRILANRSSASSGGATLQANIQRRPLPKPSSNMSAATTMPVCRQEENRRAMGLPKPASNMPQSIMPISKYLQEGMLIPLIFI
jgi:hypothetical protein